MTNPVFTLTPDITYSVRRNNRAKRFSITVYPDGRVAVTIPRRGSERGAHRYIRKYAEWVERQLEHIDTEDRIILDCTGSRAEYLSYKEEARDYITDLVEEYAAAYGFDYGRISIRNQRSRWGSCSSKGNLSFNYQILFLPEYMQRYIIVHEICHLRELNHSHRFWALVQQEIPNYPDIVAELRRCVPRHA